jgi:signal transduction histidine kinase/HAMP domain-containing protein
MTAEAESAKAGTSDPVTGPPNSVTDEPGETVVRPPDQPDPVFHDRTIPAPAVGAGIGFRTRLTFALIAAAVIPLAVFGLLLIASLRLPDPISTVPRLLLLFVTLVALIAVLVAYLLAADLTSPLRAIAAAVDRVSAGDLSTPITVGGDDELSRLAESHNRLAGALERRNRELGRILSAIEHASPRDGVEYLVGRASTDARTAFGMIDALILLVDPTTVEDEEAIPGDPRPIRAELRAGEERLGLIVGHLPATRAWEPADQSLLELFGAEIGVAVRNAQLFQRVADQNSRLVELDAAKDDFLRGVSHNLQTPLTSIRAFAEQLEEEHPDRRLSIITEQSERLSRMVRQLLTVTRLESGALRPQAEVLGLGPRARRAWEALAANDVAFSIDDRSGGWLAVADADQLDQVLWALLDNALKYGRHQPIEVEITTDPALGRILLTIIDHGPGVAEQDRQRLFERFARGSGTNAEDGSGLGLYVSRELCRAMAGDLVVEPLRAGQGAAFTVSLPGEAPLES